MESSEVKRFVLSQGADLVGIASTESLTEIPGYKPTDLLPGAKSTIVVAKRLLLRSSTVTGTVSEKSLQGLVDSFRASGAIKGPVSAEQAVNFSFLREVQKEMGLPVQPDLNIR